MMIKKIQVTKSKLFFLGMVHLLLGGAAYIWSYHPTHFEIILSCMNMKLEYNADEYQIWHLVIKKLNGTVHSYVSPAGLCGANY